MDLKKWLQIMQAYEAGGHAYHATMPTDALTRSRDVMLETRAYGFERLRAEQLELGRRVRELLVARGFPSVSAAGFQAPGVVVSYTRDEGLHKGTAFLADPKYRAYLFEQLHAETFEMETAALAHVAYANAIPYIAFRSLSDLAGAEEFNPDAVALFASGLAETNEAAVTLAFLDGWHQRR